MKTKILIALTMMIGFSIFERIFSQSLIPLDNSSRWFVGKDYGWTYPELFEYFIYNDTVILNKTYKKLYRRAYHCYENVYLGPDPVDIYDGSGAIPFTGYAGAIREDTSLKKIFFIPYNTINEFVLYDFSPHSVGDTIEVWNYITNSLFIPSVNGNCNPLWSFNVYYGYLAKSIKDYDYNTKIQKYLMNYFYITYNQNNQQILMECYHPTYWIKGVGSSSGLLEHIGFKLESPNYNTFQLRFKLLCFENAGKVKYPFSDTTKCCCDSVVNLRKLHFNDLNETEFQIIPDKKQTPSIPPINSDIPKQIEYINEEK
jgi:hypothetical protein